MDNIKYVPNHIYDEINSKLNDLKEQSNRLKETFNNLENKCNDLEIIQEDDINNIIETLRNYVLLKENCLEKSSTIISIEDISSIKDLSDKINAHRNKSIEIINDILYYAYEFLKISSNNIITDGLLQDHKEKLRSIINKALNNFVNIDELSEQIKPYKIAILYILKKIDDLTEYAELLNSTFGAILFYNIISGNNIQYIPEATIEIKPIYDETSNIIDIYDETPLAFFENTPNDDIELLSSEEFTNYEISSMDIDNNIDDIISDNNIDTELNEDVQEKSQTEQNFELNDTDTIENSSYDDTIENISTNEDYFEILQSLEDDLSNINENEDENQKLEQLKEETQTLSEEVEETSTLQETNISLEETSINDETAEISNVETIQSIEDISNNDIQEIITEQSKENQEDIPTSNLELEVESNSNIQLQSLESNSVDTPTEIELELNETTESKNQQIVQQLTDKIFTYQDSLIVDFPKNTNKSNSEDIINNIYELIVDGHICCASLVLKEYSYIEKFNIFYTQFGLAMGDPMLQNYDYSTAFSCSFNSQLQPWLEFSAIIRMMFTSDNKESNSYNFSAYIKNIEQTSPDMISNICKFNELLEIFNFVNYNMDYIIGVRAYEERTNIINDLKNKARTSLASCEQISSSWKNNRAKISNSLFSTNTGYLYNLIKQISLGNLEVIPEIKTYCEKFLNPDGTIIENSILDYFEQLWSDIGESKHSNEFNNSYKKFYDKLSNIIKFFSLCIQKTNDFESNHINSENVTKYREKRNILLKIIQINIMPSLKKQLKSVETSYIDTIGITCLLSTFNEIISYIINYENPTNNYYYISLAWTGCFTLNDDFMPYLYEQINEITGLSIYERVQAHLKDIQKIDDWKSAIKYNVKRNNRNNVTQIITWVKDTNQTTKSLEEYIIQLENAFYNLENKSKTFINTLDNLYINETLCDMGVINKLRSIEQTIKDIVSKNGNYGFYENILSKLGDYALEVAKNEYSKDNIINSIEDTNYYQTIHKYVNDYNYAVSDELLIAMHSNQECPTEIFEDDTIKEYNQIFNHFNDFSKKYANDLSSPNGYIFMNEFYNTYIKSIVNNLFAGSYDCVKSDELIDAWSKGTNIVTDVVYDVLTNIGFGIEKSTQVDDSNTIFDIVLSNSEQKNTIPYVIPQRTMFLNQLYNISQVRLKLSNIDIKQDTLIILDYAVKNSEREYVFETIKEINKGYNVVVVDRCVIMYLTTIPKVQRQLAFKVCSIFDIEKNNFINKDFRCNYIDLLSKKAEYHNTLLLGDKGFGKTTILKSLQKIFSQNNDIALFIDIYNDCLDTPTKLGDIFENNQIKIYYDTWTAFEKSLSSYLKKNINTTIHLLIDNADTFLNSDNPLEVLSILQDISNKFSNFDYIIAVDNRYSYLSYAEKLNINRVILEPLKYYEVTELFKNNLNAVKISISNIDVMNTLISKAFGSPKLVELISKQIVKTINTENNIFNGKYFYELTTSMIYKSLSNKDFIKSLIYSLLQMIVSNETSNFNGMLVVFYSIVYCLNENSCCTTSDIKDILNLNNIEENDTFNIQNNINQLVDLNIINLVNGSYYFTHNAFRYYFGNSDFSINILSEYSKLLEKDGII